MEAINTEHEFYEKKKFYNKTLLIALPIVLQNILQNVLVFIDKYMVSSINEKAFTAVGIANQYNFILFLGLYGIGSGMAIFASQFYGSKNYKGIAKALGVTLTFAVMLALILSAGALIFPRQIMSLFTKDEETIKLGIAFIRIASIAYIFSSIEFSIVAILRSIGRVYVPTILFIISIMINTVLNYLLIGGNFGFPELGIEGAAIATLTAKAFAMTALILYMILRKDKEISFNIKIVFSYNLEFVKKLFKKASPVLLNETLWGIATTALVMIYAMSGEKSLTAYMASNDAISFAWVCNIAIATAAAVILGKTLGANEIGTAKLYAKRFMKLSIISSIAIIVLIIVLSPLLVNILNLSDEVKKIAIVIIYIQAAFFLFKSFNALMAIGILKSGGDTLFAMLVDSLPLLIISIPLCLIAAIFFNAGIVALIIIGNFVEVCKILVVWKRFKSGKWANNIT